MKRTLVILLLLIGVSSYGQRIRFSDSTNVWHGYTYSCGGDPGTYAYTAHFTGDTLIGGMIYRRMSHSSFIREDTVAKKVFAIMAIHDTDTTEKILYDYNLTPGDTLKGTYINQIVDSIDSVVINGVWHRVWYFEPTQPWGTSPFIGYDVVEGIGCLYSPLYPLYPYFFEGCTQLTCFSNEGTTPELSHTVGAYFNNTTSCSLTFGLGMNNVADKNQNALVIPNPINENSKVVFPYSITSGTLVVVNGIGQVVVIISFQNKEELIIGDKIKVPGIYCFRVRDNVSGKMYSGKFLAR